MTSSPTDLSGASPLDSHWVRFAAAMARVSRAPRTQSELSLDRPINLDPDADIARTGTQEADTCTHGMTLAELLAP